MVYIDKNIDKIAILRSKLNRTINGVTLINQVDKNKIEIEVKDFDIEYKKNEYLIKSYIFLEKLSVTGQYDYYLLEDDNVIESGILQFNNFEPEIKSYEIENKNTIQYEG